MGQFYEWLGTRKSERIRPAVMDMWRPFRNATHSHAPQPAIIFGKFHIMATWARRWTRRFFENWRAALKWQRLGPYEKFAEMIDRRWD